jgi:hypothetical protein
MRSANGHAITGQAMPCRESAAEKFIARSAEREMTSIADDLKRHFDFTVERLRSDKDDAVGIGVFGTTPEKRY